MGKFNRTKKFIAVGMIAISSASVLSGCVSQAQVSSDNISKAADNFEVNRRVTLINGITNETTYVVEGFCSIDKDIDKNHLTVTCKEPDGGFTKDYLGLSDNNYYLLEQLETKDVSVYHRRIIINPKTIIPDVDVQVEGK